MRRRTKVSPARCREGFLDVGERDHSFLIPFAGRSWGSHRGRVARATRRRPGRRPSGGRRRLRRSEDQTGRLRRGGSPGNGSGRERRFRPRASRWPRGGAPCATTSRRTSRGRGAEGRADADLAGALGDAVGDDAVDADRGEHQGEGAEEAQQECREPPARHGLGEIGVQRLDPRDRLVGVDPVDRRYARRGRATADRSGCGRRVSSRERRVLRVRKEDFGLYRHVQPFLRDVPDDADDLAERSVVLRKPLLDPLSQRAPARPPPPGHAFVDDDDRRRIRRIARR